MRPRLLDLFCGAGGAAMGYARAGFDVVGVDIKPQPHYPFEFIQADALDVLTRLVDERGWQGYRRRSSPRMDAIHASPPCHDHSMARNSAGLDGTGWMLQAILDLLRQQTLPWVVENVVGAKPLRSAVELCGASFGLSAAGMDLPRHRRFELSFPLLVPPCQHRPGHTLGVYGHGTNAWHRAKLGRNITKAEMDEAMGIDWMSRDELTQAIPPAMTEYLGRQLLEHIERTEVAEVSK